LLSPWLLLPLSHDKRMQVSNEADAEELGTGSRNTLPLRSFIGRLATIYIYYCDNMSS
jgi:hypothetical protein